MKESYVTVTSKEGQQYQVEKGISLLELSKRFEAQFETPIVLAIVNNNLKELRCQVKEDCSIDFIDMTHKDGYRTYQRSLSFLLIKSVHDILGKQCQKVIIHQAIGKGYYCEIRGQVKVTEQLLHKVKDKMMELVKRDIPYNKRTVSLSKALEIFEKAEMLDKVQLFKYRRVSNVNLYQLEDFENYFYGYMVPSTGYLKDFDLIDYHDGFILQFFNRNKPNRVASFNPQKKLFNVIHEASQWGEIMKVDTVGGLNDIISGGRINELILVSEALQEKKIAEISDAIIRDIGHKKIVLIAGPSSSGKTTFAHRLAIQLKVHGISPHTISVDNYFVNRELTPKDENGNFDFERLEALDIKQFNQDMMQLLEGKAVDLPNFNFKTGRRYYRGNLLQLEEKDILIIEGIHCLNDQLSYSIPKENKFKIYISALTQLNIDDHNRISTTQARLLRRIVRDNNYRGLSALDTIAMWPSVRRGEEKYIFPHQEEADAMFNSALVYELAILKQYAEPLLFNIPKDRVEFLEAKRLIKFLDYFLGVSSEKIPYNSLIREFIGGSCFR